MSYKRFLILIKASVKITDNNNKNKILALIVLQIVQSCTKYLKNLKKHELIVFKVPVNLWENREMYGIMSGRNKREGN